MGLGSLFAFFRGDSKPKNNTTSSPMRQTTAPRSGWADYNHGRPQDTASNVTALPTPPKNTYYASDERSERSERRKSRAPTVARSTPQHTKKSNRRSWYGGRPDPEEDVPAVPCSAQQNGTSKDLATTNTVEVGEGRERRPSMARSIHRMKSWYKSQEPSVTVEALPPMPVTVTQPTKAATSTLPADQRRRRNSIKAVERRGSIASTVRSKSKRSSFWASSNPDDSDSEDVPPVPALTRDRTPDSNSSVASSRRSRGYQGASRGDRQSRPLSMTSSVSTASRRSYVPKSAAKGFLKSTNGASDEQRRRFRQSFALEEDADLVCLTYEQQIAWANLMNDRAKFDDPEPTRTDEEKASARYSNAQALAALEFGVR